MHPEADWYFEKETPWQKEIQQLRKIVLDCGLTEAVKWGCPCYTQSKHNIVLIHIFKEYCALLFFKGALMADPAGILVQQTENVQSARQIRFSNIKAVKDLAPTLKNYIYEAIAIQEAGLKVKLKKTKDYAVPEEFQQKLEEDTRLKSAFETLTPGRQRAYLFHFGQARQSKTRISRIEKYIPKILSGKGLDDT